MTSDIYWERNTWYNVLYSQLLPPPSIQNFVSRVLRVRAAADSYRTLIARSFSNQTNNSKYCRICQPSSVVRAHSWEGNSLCSPADFHSVSSISRESQGYFWRCQATCGWSVFVSLLFFEVSSDWKRVKSTWGVGERVIEGGQPSQGLMRNGLGLLSRWSLFASIFIAFWFSCV